MTDVKTLRLFPNSFRRFYPSYLAMHSHRVNRRLHVLGNALGVAAVILAIVARSWLPFVAAPVLVNGCAWLGHFGFQKNQPGVFRYPLYGAIGSWVMTWQVVTGKLRL